MRRRKEVSKIRLDGVQDDPEVRQETVQTLTEDREFRLDTVRENVTQFGEIRLESVQTDVLAEQGGQASREFLPNTGEN